MENQNGENSYSTASLTLGILSILVPLIGFILGVVASSLLRRRNKLLKRKMV
ncbi:hypothetical protein [Alkalibacillus haloalkaliphilus]|uniref:hypothetical protein n=1 Tax=Alkalibacillus haloalkaliphilus TaxID=94136 RepID=UPI0002F2FFF9|nr:hypothetical protein [Alkalibacillus haloalkaliphilus]